MEISKILDKISNYDLILFDFDETLFKTNHIHEKAYKIADIKKSKNRYKEKCKAFIDLIEIEEIEIVEITLLIYLYVTFLGKKRAIVSATLEENVKSVLNKSQINFSFDKIYCGGLLKSRNKPDPFMHKNAMSYFNVQKEKTIILEDSETGFAAAKNANIDCFDVKNICFYYNV